MRLTLSEWAYPHPQPDENKKLKQDVDDLVVQIKEKDHGIQQLSQTMERMRIEVMEAHDSGKK